MQAQNNRKGSNITIFKVLKILDLCTTKERGGSFFYLFQMQVVKLHIDYE
jgi:hypothetical protein